MTLTGINMAYTLDLPIRGETSGILNANRNFRHGDTLALSVSNRGGQPRATAKLFYRFEDISYDAIELAEESLQE